MTPPSAPETDPNASARTYAHPSSSPSISSSASSLPTLVVAGEGGRGWIELLVERGVNPGKAQELAAQFDPDRLRAAVAYFDAQRPGTVGPGVLVKAVLEGRSPTRQGPRSVLDEQLEYAASIVTWLRAHFPDLDRPEWGPHPAAVAAVIRLHGQRLKGRLTVSEHGPEIRRAVREWDAKWGAPA